MWKGTQDLTPCWAVSLLGKAEVGFLPKPQTKDAGALFWSCPSETIRTQRLPGLTKQKAQGLFLHWLDPTVPLQRWQNTMHWDSCAVWKHVLCKCASQRTCFCHPNASLHCHIEEEQHCCCCSSAPCFANHFVNAQIFLSSLWGEKIPKWISLFWDACHFSVCLNRDGVYIILL